jgi:hypothetical protein
VGSVAKVEMATPIDLIYKVLLPSISTFETPPMPDIPRAPSIDSSIYTQKRDFFAQK